MPRYQKLATDPCPWAIWANPNRTVLRAAGTVDWTVMSAGTWTYRAKFNEKTVNAVLPKYNPNGLKLAFWVEGAPCSGGLIRLEINRRKGPFNNAERYARLLLSVGRAYLISTRCDGTPCPLTSGSYIKNITVLSAYNHGLTVYGVGTGRAEVAFDMDGYPAWGINPTSVMVSAAAGNMGIEATGW